MTKPAEANERAAAPVSNDDRIQPQTYSVEEAGKILGISRGNAFKLAKDGKLPTIRLGHRLLVPKAALDKMLMV
jgi:excisionase family DNA binding protein